MDLSTLKPAEGSTKRRKRVGRGEGSKRGGTSTRGHKGAQSRSGYSRKRGFEGGQMPLYRRVPKYGFKNPNRVEYAALNLDTLLQLAETHKVTRVDIDFLVSHGFVSKKDKVKVLARGEISTAIEVQAHAFSKKAVELIEGSNGKVELIS